MEGPSIVILVEEAQKFLGRRVLSSLGSSKQIDIKSLKKQKLLKLLSWGKHFLLLFEKSLLKVHFMMFGSYRIDDPKPGIKPRLALKFKNGTLLMYACSVRELHEPIQSLYDWRSDVMSPQWDENLAIEKLRKLRNKQKSVMVCDALLDQDIFAGAGNIIKNEVLFRIQLNPEIKLQQLSNDELRLLVRGTRLYSLQFYIWKKQYLLRKNWLIYRKKNCSTCNTKVRMNSTGKFQRRSFFCPVCQKSPTKNNRQKVTIAGVRKRLKIYTQQIDMLRREIPQIISIGPVEKEH